MGFFQNTRADIIKINNKEDCSMKFFPVGTILHINFGKYDVICQCVIDNRPRRYGNYNYDDIHGYYGDCDECALKHNCAKCMSSEREDLENVYFKKIN